MDTRRAIQDSYPDELAHCYGCGRLNASGLHIRSYVEGSEVVATVVPRADQIAVPGFVYGGLIAAVLDCHCNATAAAAARDAAGGEVKRFVTASLKVDFLKPTPTGVPLEARARATSVAGRKVVVSGEVIVEGQVRARAELVAVELPPSMRGHGSPQAPRNPPP